VRRPGAGPKRKVDLDPDLLVVLDSLVEPESRGDPMSPLRWTAKSTRTLAAELTRLGHKVGANLVGDLLHYLGYSLQANAKVTEGAQHPDRDAQFRYINDTAAEHLAANQPVISVDCKKKELVGDYKNGGAGAGGLADARRCARLPRPRDGKGDPLRSPRRRGERRMGERRRPPRHPGVRSCLDRAVVGADGTSPLPRGDASHDHRRRRWVEQLPLAGVQS